MYVKRMSHHNTWGILDRKGKSKKASTNHAHTRHMMLVLSIYFRMYTSSGYCEEVPFSRGDSSPERKK